MNSLVARALGAVLLCCAFSAGHAATVVPGGDASVVIDIPEGNFVIAIAADENGMFNQRYRNSSGAVIDRLSFRFSPSLPSSPKAESGFFDEVIVDRDLVIFDLGSSGSGIPMASTFRIRMGGLVPFTSSTFGPADPGPFGTPVPVSAVPLPPAALMLASVLAVGFGGRRLTRLRAT